MNLYLELFKEDDVNRKEPHWSSLIECLLPKVIKKTRSEKAFIASVAKAGAAATACKAPHRTACNLFIAASCDKDLGIAEFSIQCLCKLVLAAQPEFFKVDEHFKSLIKFLLKQHQEKKPRMIKFALPMLNHVKSKLSETEFKELLQQCATFKPTVNDVVGKLAEGTRNSQPTTAKSVNNMKE